MGKELPNEVLASILLHLRYETDKTTLARCMRVSTTFKALVAPMLYEKMDWEDWKGGHWPVVAKDKGNGRGAVQVESNVYDLRLIKTVEIQHHFVKDCPRSFGIRYRRQPIEVSVLRLMADRTEDIARLDYGSAKAVCIQGVSFSLLAELAPRKIIVRSDGSRHNPAVHWGRINQDRLDSHVIQLDLSHSEDWLEPMVPLASRPKRLIVVLTPPEQYAVLGHPATAKMIGVCIVMIACHLGMYCRLRHSASDVVLVNFDALDVRFPTNPLGTFEDACRKMMLLRVPLVPPPKGAIWKTESELKLVTFKSVTMREYLTTYDWSGEYTENEAAKMLAEEGEGSRD